MNQTINVGKKESTLSILTRIKNNDYVPFDIRITNSHITKLNAIIGRKIFKKDVLYVNSKTLWEIMQPIGGIGRHHYHNLSPNDIYNALVTLRESKEIVPSYNGRYLIITLATYNGVSLAIVVDPNGTINGKNGLAIIKIITIYPYDKK